MAIKVTCPTCKHPFKVPDEYAGRKGRCPKCKEVFRAPDLEVFEEVAPKAEDSLAGDEWLDDEPAPPPAKQPPAKQPASAPRISAGKRRSKSSSADLGNLGSSAPAGGVVKLSGPAKGKTKSKKSSSGAKGPSEGLPKWVLPASIGAAVLAVVLGIGLVTVLVGGGDDPVVQNDDTTQPASTDTSSGKTPAREETATAAATPDPTPQDLATQWDQLHEGVVSLTIETTSGTKKALGFIVDPSGLVIAHYHDVAAPEVQAVRAEVAGLRLEFAGAVAASRDLDLVLLKLNMLVPVALKSFELASAEPIANQSLYVASNEAGQKGLTPTVVDRVMRSRDLPQSSRAVLREWRMDEIDPLTWIQTTVPGPATATGGPLLDSQGKVLGVNTILSPNSPHGYAIHVRHVADLLEHARKEPLPLEPDSLANLQDDLDLGQAGSGGVAQNDPGETPGGGGGPSDPGDDLPADPGDDVVGGIAPPTDADYQTFSPEQIAKTRDICASFDFTPTTDAEYEWLLFLAVFLNKSEDFVDDPSRDVPPEFAARIREEIEATLTQLEGLAFSDARIEAVNQFGKAYLKDAPGTFVCFYGRVVIDTSQFNIDSGAGKHAAILAIEGTGDQVIIPALQDSHTQLKIGSRWLIMGEYNSRWTFTNGETGTTNEVPYVLGRYAISEN